MENRFGLKRDVPAEIQRQVRQHCGFGCVVCGNAFYQYEHVDPEFTDAHEHDPTRIALLCGGCHDRVTRGALSKETVKAHLQNPKCRQTGFSFGPFDIGPNAPEIVVGSFRGRMTRSLISIDGESILAISPPEVSGGPFRIDADLRDIEGGQILAIESNCWRVPTTNWDVEVVGSRISVRCAPRNIALVLRTEPPERLFIERLEMNHRGTTVRCREGEFIEITTPNGTVMRTGSVVADNCLVGVQVNGDSVALGVGMGATSKVRIAEAKSRTPEGRRGLLIQNCTFGGNIQNAVLVEGGRTPGKNPEKGRRIRQVPKNHRCPCGSGRKYKLCHGRTDGSPKSP